METTISPHDAWRILLRHKRKMILFFLAVMALTVLTTLLGPRTYRSEAKLLLRLGRENVALDPTATLGQPGVMVMPQSRENEINSVIEVLKSRPIIERMVDSVGPETIVGSEPPRDPAPAPPGTAGSSVLDGASATAAKEREEAIRTVAKVLDVEAVKHSNVILIAYESSSPESAQAVVSRLIEYYLEQHVILNRTPEAHKFLGEQAARLRSQLMRSEEDLRTLKTETGLADPQTQRQLLLTRIGHLEDDLAQTTTSLAAAKAEVTVLKERLAALPAVHVTARTKGMPNLAVDGMRGQLYALELKEQELLAKHLERHPDVQLARQQVTAAKSILANEEKDREQVTTGPNRIWEEAQVALLRQEPLVASLTARAATLREQLDRERDQVKVLTANQVRVSRLQREVELQENDYRKYVSSLEQTRIDQALEQGKISNVRVVQPATGDRKHVRPRLGVNLALGFVFGVAGAVALAMRAEKRRRMKDEKNRF